MLAAGDHFGWKVVEGSAECCATRCRGVDGPTEVCELEIAVQADEDVLWLDVAVDDVLCVAVVDGVAHLDDVVCRRLLVESFSVAEHFEELTARCVLDDEVDASLVPEEPVEADDVRVAQLRLNFDLAAELAFHGFLLELGFVEDLDSNNEL